MNLPNISNGIHTNGFSTKDSCAYEGRGGVCEES